MVSEEFLAEVKGMPQRNLALGADESAMQVLGDEHLRVIARDLVKTVKGKVTIDWTLRKYGYPPDLQKAATDAVIVQAETLSEGWALA